MAFNDLNNIGNSYKTVENDTDQSERIMEENSIVRDLITKILDDGGPTDTGSSIPPPDKTLNGIQTNGHYPKNDSYLPTPYNAYQSPLSNYNYGQNEQNGYNYNMQNGFGNTNGYVNYDNDVNTLLGVELPDPNDTVTTEQLNLLRLAAQQIGGAQFQSPNKYDYNFFEPNQRNSMPETNMFPPNNYNRPNSLNLDMNYNNFDNQFNNQRYPNNFKDNQDPSDILSYLTQLNMSLDRSTQENNINNIDFKMPLDLNGHYQNDDFKMVDDRNKMYYNRNFQNQPNKNFDNNQFFEMGQMDRSPLNQMNFDYSNQTHVSNANNFKPNGYNHNDYMRRDMNQMMHRDGYPNDQRNNYESNVGRDNIQQMALMRQNQELARQMNLLMRNRPPPNPLNVDVSFLHENNPYNLGIGALLGPSPPVPPPVLPSPMLDMPLLAPFYAMRNMRNAAPSSGILHARLDACYEQWRQLERERKRTEARLALAYPGRAVSSSNSIPVPRLPPCPSRVDRLTVDMLREHTKVLTLMGKMETLRASVCLAQNKKPTKPEENKITVLKRGQENVASESKDGLDPASFDPSTWREDVKHLAEIAPHKEVEAAMLAWRSAVSAVQNARKREMHPAHANRHHSDPIMHLAEAVKQLCVCARRARTAMWCDLTLTVALAPDSRHVPPNQSESNQSTAQSTPTKQPASDNAASNTANGQKLANGDAKEENQSAETSTSKTEVTAATASNPGTSNSASTTKNGSANKQTDKDKNHQQRRTQNYKKLNQRNDFYRNQRYDNRFMQNRHPYHYLATGPIN